MNVKNARRSGVPAGFAIVALGLLWGADFPAIDVVVSRLPPLGTAGLRFAVSGCIVLGYARLTTDRVRPESARELLSVVLVGVFTFAGYQGALYLGTQYVTGAVAAVVNTMMPVVAALVAIPFLGESRGLTDVLGFCLGAAGVLVLAQPSVNSSSSTTLGVGLVFLGTVLFALGSVTIQVLDNDLPMEALQGWAMIVGASVLFGAGALRGETVPDVQSLSLSVIASLLYIVLVSGVVGYLVFFRLVRRVGATETTLVTYLEPVSATAVSVLLLNQTVGRTTLVGFLAVAAGFTVVSRETMRRTVGRLRQADTPLSGHEPGGD